MPLFEDLCQSLAKILANYDELLKTAGEQYLLFQQGNFNQLMPLLEKKNSLFVEIDVDSKALASLKQQWLETAASAPEEQRASVNALLDKITEAHKRLMEEENKCVALAEKSKTTVSSELDKIINAKKAASAYANMKKQKP